MDWKRILVAACLILPSLVGIYIAVKFYPESPGASFSIMAVIVLSIFYFFKVLWPASKEK
jgi:hypothetical protein